MSVILILIGALGLIPGLEDVEMEDEWRPPKIQHYKDRPEYWEESWRLEETCFHTNFNEKPSSKVGVEVWAKSTWFNTTN